MTPIKANQLRQSQLKPFAVLLVYALPRDEHKNGVNHKISLRRQYDILIKLKGLLLVSLKIKGDVNKINEVVHMTAKLVCPSRITVAEPNQIIKNRR